MIFCLGLQHTEFEEMVLFHLLGCLVVNTQGVPLWTQLGF